MRLPKNNRDDNDIERKHSSTTAYTVKSVKTSVIKPTIYSKASSYAVLVHEKMCISKKHAS